MNRDIKKLKKEYTHAKLVFDDLDDFPFALFDNWIKSAIQDEGADATAMVLSTVDNNSKPSSRVVLLKEYEENSFVFYSNYLSRKGQELYRNPNAAINFFWRDSERQVRMEGVIERLDAAKSDHYFNNRPLDSQLGAIVSPQSQELPNQNYLAEEVEKLKNSGADIRRPDYWGGYVFRANVIEFWQGRPNRLNDRVVYTLENDQWIKKLLAP